jgi:hydroxymethylbilane synthase
VTAGSTTVPTTLRLGTRRSSLALAQSATVAEAVRQHGREVALIEVVTEGDRSTAALSAIGGTGVFVTELRRRLLDGDIDLAVHSLKDLPTLPAAGLVVAAIPSREDPRDALVSGDGATLNQLAAGARVGTGSPRRAAQLRALGLGLEVVPMRGNVDTRLRRVADGDVDAIVVAAAGLARLGRLDEATEVLDPGQLLPAPGQGALAVECRADDAVLCGLLGVLDDARTRAAVTAERALLAALEAGCTAPVGALADVAIGDDGEDEIYLRAVVAEPDGSHTIRLSATGPSSDPEGLGHRLAGDLLEAGAAGLIGENP